jgi:uncharacterized protein
MPPWTRALEPQILGGAMSQENVEVVRRVYEVWNAGDMTALRDLCDPDVVMHHPDGWPEPGPSGGREAVMRQWEQIREAWTGDTLAPVTEFITAADRVVVRDAWSGTGQGPDADMEFTRVFTLRERKIIDVDIFWDHGEALEAVGLGEP